MRAMEQTILKSIARKRIDGNSTAKKNLCLKILKQYENQIDKKEEYLGVKLFKARKFVAKFSA